MADVNLLIEIDPKEWRAYIMRAELELANGHPERTIADIETIRSFGTFAGDETSLILAQAQIMSDRPKEALAALDAALASYPTKADPELQEKALRVATGRHGEARRQGRRGRNLYALAAGGGPEPDPADAGFPQEHGLE